MFSGPYLLLWIIVLVLDIIALAAILSGRKAAGEKLLWSVLIILLPIIGLILYYVLGRDRRDEQILT